MSAPKKLEWEEGLTSSTWNSLTAIEKKLFFVAAKDNDKFYWMCFNVDSSLISRAQLNATTPLFDTLEEAQESAQSYFENIYSRFYEKQYCPGHINRIFTLKDISGIPHAISADVIEAALMKEEITLFDLKISEIAKLRQERNEAVARLQRINEALENIT